MIETKEEIVAPAIDFPDTKPSVWIKQQPLSRLCSGQLIDAEGRKCGLGILADFYGFDWSTVELQEFQDRLIPTQATADAVRELIESKFEGHLPFSPIAFDILFRDAPDQAKEYVIDKLEELGL